MLCLRSLCCVGGNISSLLLHTRLTELRFVAGIKHRNRTPRTRTIQTKGKGRVKPFSRMILDTLTDWKQPEELKPLWHTCDRRFSDRFEEEEPALHPYEEVLVKDLSNRLKNVSLAVAFFNINMTDDSREFRFYKFRFHGLHFVSRPARIFDYALRNTRLDNLRNLLTGEMPILVLSDATEGEELQGLKELFKLVRGDQNMLMLGGYFCDRLLSLDGLQKAAELKELTSMRTETVAITQLQSNSLSMNLQQQQIYLCKQLEQIREMKS